MADIRITPASSIMSFTSSLNFIEKITQDPSGSLNLYGSGSTGRTDILSVDGNNGRLFTVSDDLSDSLFSVNTIAGLPVIEAFANNTVVMGQYGQNVLVVTGSRVGIGTTSPIYKLDVNGSISTNSFFRIGDISAQIGVIGSATSIFGSGGNDWTFYNGAATSNVFYTSGTERMRITSSGQVQISSPISDALKLTNTNSGAYNGILVQNDASNQVVLGMGGSTVGGTNQNRGYSGTVSNIDYYLMTNNSPRLLITSGGNVGIGTTTPSEKLDVEGVIRGLFSGNPGTGGITGKFLTFSSSPYGLTFRGYGTGTHSIQVQRESNDAEMFPLSLQPNGGNVGIGTTSPSEKLDVNGVIKSNNDIISSNGTISSVLAYSSTYGAVFGSTSNHNANIYTNSLPRLTITTNGNVGIGTTSPIHKVSVNGKIGGDVYADSFVEFTATTETIVSADGNVVLGYAQNVVVDNEGSVGVGTIAPEACAAVEIKSITQGFLPPRMRTGERDNIGSPVAGLMIFNTDDEVVQVYTNGSGWRTLAFL